MHRRATHPIRIATALAAIAFAALMFVMSMAQADAAPHQLPPSPIVLADAHTF